jgi:hypothetical protein
VDATATTRSVAIPETKPWIAGEILRDIARGGLAGLIIGIVGVGLGSRLVMRLAAILVPEAVGSFTENGFRIGDITVGGTVGLIMFGGFAGTIALGLVWVVVSPWLPGPWVVKAIVTTPIAVAIGSFALIDGRNPDFAILHHDPLVVASLVGLIALLAPLLAAVDAWLDRRLPHPASWATPAAVAYVALTVIGGSLAILLLGTSGSDPKVLPLRLIVIGVGIATAAWWALRLNGRTYPPRPLALAAWAVLLVGTAAGFAALLPEVTHALGVI